jgi:MYXO-CTERM domain-containing protein
VNKTVLAALLAVAGSATAAQAQFAIEARLVVDGSADAPSTPGIQSFLPGPQATRVGLTLQARIIQNAATTVASAGNYGIGGVLNPAATNTARFTHNDTTFSGGTYQPFSRGRTGTVLGLDGLPVAGAFGAEGGRDFRAGAINTAASDVNGPQNNGAGANGANAASANGFFPAAGGQLNFIQAVVPSLSDGLGTSPLFAVGQFSPWYNLYRVYFEPKPNASDPVRDVTVSFFGRFLGVTRFIGSPVPQYTLGNASGITGGLLETTVSATFQVPTPGAAALLGLGGLIAGRRRRA